MRFAQPVVYDVVRLSVGYSTTGTMAGTSSSKNNAVIGIPGSGVQQYDLNGNTLSTIVPNPTSGTSNMVLTQNATSTSISWRRQANNGDPNAAQISLTGSTIVIWGFGHSNAYVASPLPPMSKLVVDLAGVMTPTASPTPSVSAGASASPSPTYAFSATLTSGFTLKWNRRGTWFDFYAVLNRIGWCVELG